MKYTFELNGEYHPNDYILIDNIKHFVESDQEVIEAIRKHCPVTVTTGPLTKLKFETDKDIKESLTSPVSAIFTTTVHGKN